MKKILKSAIFFSLMVSSPIITFAQSIGSSVSGATDSLLGTGSAAGGAASSCPVGGIGALLCNTQLFLNAVVPILVALGVVYFVWGVVQYVIGGGEEAKTKGRDKIVYGLIGFAIIIGLWGIVALTVETLGVGAQTVNMPALVPTTTAAATGNCDIPTTGAKLQNYLGYATCIIGNAVIPFIFAIAVVMFIWGAVKFFIINSDEEAKREQGKQFMIWGIVALAVMLSVWGLVGILGSTSILTPVFFLMFTLRLPSVLTMPVV